MYSVVKFIVVALAVPFVKVLKMRNELAKLQKALQGNLLSHRAR